ncbi:MAG: DUF5362 domain-containing protein [Spirochaetales bacterium]|nr:DUF5362 domain-containing protein [Spirochaetales bacterium]
MTDFTNQPQPQQASGSLNLNPATITSLSGWAQFIAVMNIIGGVVVCFGIITAAIGVPIIIAGMRLFNAANDLKQYLVTKNTGMIASAFDKLKSYFLINGVIMIVYFALMILYFIILIIVIAATAASGNF